MWLCVVLLLLLVTRVTAPLFPPADSPSQPKIRAVSAHCPLSDVRCRKKSIPMCLACTALQQSRPASGNRRCCRLALGCPYIMLGTGYQINPDEYILTSQNRKEPFLHYSDAIEVTFVSLWMHFFLQRTIFVAMIQVIAFICFSGRTCSVSGC